MTTERVPVNPDDLIRDYRSGMSIQEIMNKTGRPRSFVRKTLTDNGVTIRRKRPASAIQATATARTWVPPDEAELIARYQAGESVNSLAQHYGVSRGPITRLVRGLPCYRRPGDANRLSAAGRTPEQHAAWAVAAQAARRGQKESIELRTSRALAKQGTFRGASDNELRLMAMLNARGIEDVVPQQAIGPYNCDLGISPVAVEIFGGHWHSTGHHRARFPERARYILDQGWLLVIAWVTWYEPLRPGLADYVVALVEESRADPSLAGQYRVVWGSGEDCTRPGLDLDEVTQVPPRVGSKYWRT